MSDSITLEQLSNETGMSRSSIYHWITMGVLPKPKHIANKKGGHLSVYPRQIIVYIEKIKALLKSRRSLKEAKKTIGGFNLCKDDYCYICGSILEIAVSPSAYINVCHNCKILISFTERTIND